MSNNNNTTTNRALASIINSARTAVRSERERRTSTLFQNTRNNFRRMNDRSTRGRRPNDTWKKQIFLLRRCNPDFYPSNSECTYLQDHGFGRVPGKIQRSWSINRIQRYIIQAYATIPLEDTGFRFARCSKDKKIILADSISSIEHLEQFIGRSTLIVVPNEDLELVENVCAAESQDTRPSTSDRRRSRYVLSDDSDFEPIGDHPTLPTARTEHSRNENSNFPSRTQTNTITNERQEPYTNRNYRNSTSLVQQDLFHELSRDYSDEEMEENTVAEELPDVEMLNLLDDNVEIVTVEISRDILWLQMLELYKDEQLPLKAIKVAFKGEIGLDYGGLTKELFTKFWKECRTEYFRGEHACVPFLSLAKIRKGLADDFIILGRILTHTLLLTKTLPSHFAKTFYLLLGDTDTKVPDHIVKEDFFSFITPAEKKLIMKALNAFATLTEEEKSTVIDFYEAYGLQELPSENLIQQQIHVIAEKVMCKDPLELIKKLKSGIPLSLERFFLRLNNEKLSIWYKKQAPTAKKVINCIETTPIELNNVQSRTLYFFKMFLSNLSLTDLSKFLLFVTSSEHMPEKIILSFKHVGFPVAHSCSNTLELSTNYSTYQELSEVLGAIIRDDRCFEYNIL